MGEVSTTPWPIELGTHPFRERKQRNRKPEVKKLPSSERELTEAQRMEIAQECFRQPKEYRDLVLETVHIRPLENYDGGSVFYMWLNKQCPVSCDFCFFKSPDGGTAKRSVETEISDEGIERIIQFTKDGKIDKLVVSGGGEPMMDREKVFHMVQQAKVDTFVVVTSAYWAKSKSTVDRILASYLEGSQNNPNKPTTVLRVSIDECHFKRISRGRGFKYIQNVIDWFAENAPNNPKFKLLFHTMEGDKTVDELLATLSVEKKEDTGKQFNRRTHIELEKGQKIEVEYSQVFDSNPKVDLRDEGQCSKNEQTFRDFIEHRRNGNMSLSFHGDQPKGVFYLTLYDGTTILWGATAPDVETNIYRDDYAETMKKNLSDVITLAALEKGPVYMQKLVAEVNPKAVSRAVGVGLRDFYARLMFEEDTTRLYVSIRLLQEYIVEGRINPEQVTAWPEEIRAMVSLNKDKLQEVCSQSNYTIVEEYLSDPTVDADKLYALYTYVALGHYAITPEQMKDRVAASSLPEKEKKIFASLIKTSGSKPALVNISSLEDGQEERLLAA